MHIHSIDDVNIYCILIFCILIIIIILVCKDRARAYIEGWAYIHTRTYFFHVCRAFHIYKNQVQLCNRSLLFFCMLRQVTRWWLHQSIKDNKILTYLTTSRLISNNEKSRVSLCHSKKKKNYDVVMLSIYRRLFLLKTNEQ